MADATDPATRGGSAGGRPSWATRLLMSRRFQSFASRTPGLRRIVRGEGAALFDVVQGFVRSQVLLALIELRVLESLVNGARTARSLAPGAGLTEDRMTLLLQAGAGLRLLKRWPDGSFALSMRGTAFLGVPGLDAMVQHHTVLYRDLADPVAFLRGQTQPELARFWPYVFGAAQAEDPVTAATYSHLMADSQALVAEDTLRLVDFRGTQRLLDVGGGTGAFLAAVGAAHQNIRLDLFDLPAVMLGAQSRLLQAGLGARMTLHSGSFQEDSLPTGADAISLIRVLYDHADATVAALLAKVHAALPHAGRVIISEPMSGGANPDPATDVYFAIYTAAMQTGRTRSAATIGQMLGQAGFSNIRSHPGARPYITSAVTARRD
jgi:demethylspheroidene O-methyltransferase